VTLAPRDGLGARTDRKPRRWTPDVDAAGGTQGRGADRVPSGSRPLEGLTRGFDDFSSSESMGKNVMLSSMSWSKVYDGHKVLRSSLPEERAANRKGDRGPNGKAPMRYSLQTPFLGQAAPWD